MHFVVSCLILLLSVSAYAQNLNFTEISKQLLDSEIMRSPIYVKHIARSIYLQNEQLYSKRYAELEALKKQGKLSERDFLSQTEQLKKTYQQTQLTSLPELGKAIEKNPVDSFFTLMTENNRKELLDQTNFWEQKPTEAKQQDKNTVVPAPVTPRQMPTTEKKSLQKQKLGKKSYTINVDAFK